MVWAPGPHEDHVEAVAGQGLLHGQEPVDLVDEEDVARRERGEPGRSPFFTRAGPLRHVERDAPLGVRMWASEVLPRPGGPERSTWSRASPRLRLTGNNPEVVHEFLPTYSSKLAGQSLEPLLVWAFPETSARRPSRHAGNVSTRVRPA